MSDQQYVFSTSETIRNRFPTHVNDLIMDRSQSATSEAFIVVLEPGEAPPLHVHHDTEQVFYVLQGEGSLQVGDDAGRRHPVKPGDLVRIPPGAYHRIFCEGNQPLKYLSIDCFLNGRPEAEPTWESHVHVLCDDHGWDFDKVKLGKGNW